MSIRYHRPSMAEICYGKDASQINTACLDPTVNGKDCGKSAVHPFKRQFFDFSLFSKLPNVHDLCQFLKLRKIKKLPFYPGKATDAEVS